jgi:hypothetical protein
MKKITNTLGLGNWKITIDENFVDLGDSFAMARFDIFLNEINIKLSDELIDKPEEFIKETLIHELIHSRIGIHNLKIDRLQIKIKEDEEEFLVNDLTTTLLKYIK